ncbi:uncharacterized protein LOC109812847 [Cajanus cajan]|uniref:uncharacterized protein LOC109812847 n=1 Tax=Cajanus cajan TaxID=3821 RepID=UPI00098D7D1E|nr:uncharacterized protein LOC109812847 [Cajanus cajan]
MVECASSESSRVTLSPNRKMRNCFCGVPCKVQMSSTSKNFGRNFFGCGNYDGYNKHCQFFLWCNLVDEVYENENLLSVVAAKMSEIEELKGIVDKLNRDTEIESLKDIVDEMNSKLSVLSSKVEMINEDLMAACNTIDSHVVDYRKMKFVILAFIVFIVAKVMYF